MSNALLDPQQILTAFDEHWSRFEGRLYERKHAIEVEAYRQLVESLTSQVNEAKFINARLESVLKACDIDPRQHPAWSQRP